MKKLKIFMIASLVLALGANIGSRLIKPREGPGEEKYLSYIFPEAESFSKKEGDPPHYKAYGLTPDGGKYLLGLAFLTTDILPKRRGYAGPIHILAGIGTDGNIKAIRVISHQETPSYTAVIDKPEFWDGFSGKSLSDGFVPDADVDTISRATITASAIAGSVRDSCRIAARKVLGLDVPPPSDEKPHPPLYKIILISAAVIGALLSYLFKSRGSRSVFLLFSVAALGFWMGTYISLGQLVNLVLGRAPPFSAHLEWYILFSGSIFTALVFGNIFCGWLCPFGALQELLHGLSRRLGLKTVPGAQWKEASVLRWFYLWATLMLAFALGITDAVVYEPFGTAFDWKGSLLHWLFLFSILGGAIVVSRFWCRIFCPVGAIMQLLSSGRSPAKHKFSLQRDVLHAGEDSRAGDDTR